MLGAQQQAHQHPLDQHDGQGGTEHQEVSYWTENCRYLTLHQARDSYYDCLQVGIISILYNKSIKEN